VVPIGKLLRLNWMRYRGAMRTIRHLSDFHSRCALLAYGVRCGGLSPREVLHNPDAPLLELRIRELNGRPIWCRAGLSDFGVLYDTFDGGYHVPPDTLRPIRTVLDLGSNIGLTIAHFAVLFPEARILGVEIDEENIALCRKNIAPWADRCDVIHAAAWHEAGDVAYGGTRESGYAVLNGDGGAAKGRVRSMTLGALIDQLGAATVDYVKMDIEGAESKVLANAGAWAARVRCLKVEVHPEKALPCYPVEACIADLERHGFRCSLEPRHAACVIATRG